MTHLYSFSSRYCFHLKLILFTELHIFTTLQYYPVNIKYVNSEIKIVFNFPYLKKEGPIQFIIQISDMVINTKIY